MTIVIIEYIIRQVFFCIFRIRKSALKHPVWFLCTDGTVDTSCLCNPTSGLAKISKAREKLKYFLYFTLC